MTHEVNARKCTAAVCRCGKCGTHGTGWPPDPERLAKRRRKIEAAERAKESAE